MTSPSRPVRVLVHGRAIDIEVPNAEDRAVVASVLHGFPPADSATDDHYAVRRPPDGGWIVERDGTLTHRAATLDDALLALEWQLVTDLLARPINRFHLHGAALADPSGRLTVLEPGESGTGKTTLTLALISAGFRPHTDDVVLIEPERLTPLTFERAFHVDESTRELVAALPHDADWEVPGLPGGYFLPRQWAGEPSPVGAIIFPRGRGLDQPLLVSLPVADAATALLGASGTLDTDPAMALKVAARLTAVVPCFALYSGALPATVELVQDAVNRLLPRA